MINVNYMDTHATPNFGRPRPLILRSERAITEHDIMRIVPEELAGAGMAALMVFAARLLRTNKEKAE